ncbi:MAG: hypothetical protein HY791_27325 [Deltaproteobacteria bacterium]|nr:hypothetical protein [Deltaproteobacteria bacterium]
MKQFLALVAIASGCRSEVEGPRDADLSPDAAQHVDARTDAGIDTDLGTFDAELDDATGDDSDAASPDAGQETLAAQYPGDEGLGSDPAVVWFEDFEGGTLAAIGARYDQVRDNGRMTLISDTPSGSGHAISMRAGGSEQAVDLYKQLADSDEWFVRWYARYEPGGQWHHSGMWFGGYNPASRWPSPNAGRRPGGTDRFSIAVEPVFDGPIGKRFDFYNYWMGMHSWMQEPINDDGTAYWGNALVHRNGFTVDEGNWVCMEAHVRLNSAPSGAGGAILEVWKRDELVERFDEHGPMGYWIRDKFCPEAADGRECLDYADTADTILDLRLRSAPELRLNAFWPQNYVTEASQWTLDFDQLVVATRRVGCAR